MKSYKLSDIAELIQADIRGNPNSTITGIATLQQAKSQVGVGDISFFDNLRYKKQLNNTRAIAVILREEHIAMCSVDMLLVKDPYQAYAKVANLFVPEYTPVIGIHPTAIIDKTSEIDPTASIGAYCVVEAGAVISAHCVVETGTYIGRDTRMGAHTHLYPGVKILHQVVIGEHTIIHSGAVLGADGFGFAKQKTAWLKIPQLGGVIIGDNVEIGANTTIDRGALDNTIIENGVKLDNQIQVGHGVHIGENTAIAASTAIAGSTRIGRNCMIGGLVAITGHLEVTNDVVITAMSFITHSIKEPGIYSSGTVVQENQHWRKSAIHFRHLDEWAHRLKNLEKKIQG